MDQQESLPKVSIIIPVYNGTNFLRKSIDSALNQSYKNIEIIVVNDGSTDDGKTEKLALSYGEKIKYITKENGGVASALNVGIEQMSGDYFSWLSHDDMYTSNKIEREVNVQLSSSNRNAIVFCGYQTIDEDGNKIKEYHLPKSIVDNIDCLIAIDPFYTLNGCALLIPRQLFDKYGKFSKNFDFVNDYDLWNRFQKITDFIYVDECLVLSRQHEMQDSIRKIKFTIIESDLFHFNTIMNTSLENLSNYSENKIEKFLEIYQLYSRSGYKLTAAALLSILTRHIIETKNYSFIDKLFNILGAKFNFNQLIQLQNPKQRKTITFYSNTWTFGEIEKVITVLIEKFVRDYNIVLIVENYKENDGYKLPESVVLVKIVPNNMPLYLRASYLSLISNTDLFIGNPNITIEFLPIYEVLKQMNIKTIAVNHYYYFLPFQEPWLNTVALKRREYLSYADVITWPTTFSAQVCSLINKNVIVMPNPNSFDVEETVLKREEKIVIAIGHFYDTIKRIDMILLAFNEILKKTPNAKSFLVGDYSPEIKIPGNNQNIKDLLNELDFPKNSVHFLGVQADVKQILNRASVLIMTSESEGFSLVLNEAGCCGVPVVVFDYPELEDIVIDNRNGYIVPQKDFKLMAEKVTRILNDEILWERLSSESLVLAQRFSKEVVCNRWNTLIQIVLDNKKSVPLLVDAGFTPKIATHQFSSLVVNEYERILAKNLNQSLLNSDQNNPPKSVLSRFVRYPANVLNYSKKFGLLNTLKKTYHKLFKKGVSKGSI